MSSWHEKYVLTQRKVLEELALIYEDLDELFDMLDKVTDELWNELNVIIAELIDSYIEDEMDRVRASQAQAARLEIDEAIRPYHQGIYDYFLICGAYLGESLVKTYKHSSRDAYVIMQRTPAWRDRKLDIVARHDAQVRITDTYITSNILPIPWCADGKTYSERLWGHAANFESKLRYVLNEGIVKGRGMDWMTQAWRKLVHATAYDTARLLKTETMAMYNRGLKDSYLEMGVEYVEIVGDAECGGICLDFVDGDPIKLADAEINDELPPYHPNCACSFVVYEEEENLENESEGQPEE